jgi:asparagine synthase (glutamine-hydrolysing)
MCGIFALFNVRGEKGKTRKLAAKLLKRLLHRGPDSHGITGFSINENRHHYMAHQRLAIVDPVYGHQPFFGENGRVCAVVNGEIYNHMEVS